MKFQLPPAVETRLARDTAWLPKSAIRAGILLFDFIGIILFAYAGSTHYTRPNHHERIEKTNTFGVIPVSPHLFNALTTSLY